MQLKSWERPGESCERFYFGLVRLTDREFGFQLVPPDISFKTLERGVSSMAINLTSQKSSEEQCLGGSSAVEKA